MKALLCKDFTLFFGQKRFYLMVIVLGIFLGISSKTPFVTVSYLTMLLPTFAASSIGYDEHDNGNAFLFTLPVSRKGYVLEKYVFAFLLGLGSFLLALLLSPVVSGGIDLSLLKQMFGDSFPILGIMLLLQALMIPMQLKFGSEKGRIAVFVAVAIMALIAMGSSGIGENLGLDLDAALSCVLQMDPLLLAGIALLILGLALVCSVFLSVRILQKKEF